MFSLVHEYLLQQVSLVQTIGEIKEDIEEIYTQFYI
jgi:hypothetical protein